MALRGRVVIRIRKIEDQLLFAFLILTVSAMLN